MSGDKGGNLIQDRIEVTSVYNNLSQEVVKITIDKLRLIHAQYLKDIEKRKGWIAPLGILLTIVLVFVTTSFKDAGFKADTWEAFFLMAGMLTFVWLVYTIIQVFKSKNLNDLIDAIKADDNNPSE